MLDEKEKCEPKTLLSLLTQELEVTVVSRSMIWNTKQHFVEGAGDQEYYCEQN